MTKRVSTILIALLYVFFFTGCGNKTSEKAEVKRIVSLGPSATEILYAIGAEKQLVARTDFCNYPSEAKSKPSVGGFSADSISIESIVKFEPDMVYLFSGMHDELIKPLEGLGIKVYVSQADSVTAVINEIIEIGNLTGHSDEAKQVADQMNETIAEVRNRIAEARKGDAGPRVFWQIWDEPLMSVGKNTFINDIITMAGGVNIFGQEESAYPIVSDEAVIASSPNCIFITDVSENYSSTNNKILFYAMSKNSNASVHYISDEKFSRPGPRCAKAIKELSEIIYDKSK